jgi:hypothetical protein
VRQSKCPAVPHALDVARRRGEWSQHSSESLGWRSPVREFLRGEETSRGGGVRLRGPGCALLRVVAGTQACTGWSVIPESCFGFTPATLTRGVSARPRDRRGRQPRPRAMMRVPRGRPGVRGPSCIPRARRSSMACCRRRGITECWLRRNRRHIACEAWRLWRPQASKCLQTRPISRAAQCPALGLVRPNTAGCGPTNGPTAGSTTRSQGAALRR